MVGESKGSDKWQCEGLRNTCQVLTSSKGVEVRCHYRQLHIPPAKKVPRYSFPWAMLVKGYHSLQAVEKVKWYIMSKLRNMECRTQSLPSSAFTFPDNMGTHELLGGQEKFSCSAGTIHLPLLLCAGCIINKTRVYCTVIWYRNK